ncbi:RNaseH domain-containing protein [Pseudofrankia sp. DC12]|uniref:RNaseH domain-containing protein n=1 Tax=Pseudofrankia sp. DC12 TaxID=683315 RepID=UPI000AE098B9|nr:RNaseH domain-containing protein [Pseudofrankia sp. DC12]
MDPREPGKYLNTLAFRCTPDLVGDAAVHVRHLDSETRKLWEDFDRDCKKAYRNDDAQAPYSIATTVLSVMTGGYVYFDPSWNEPFLASREPLDDQMLCRAFTLTQGLAQGQKVDAIDLKRPPELARRLAELPERALLLADHLRPTAGAQPKAPSWVYKTVGWDLARRLAAVPWKISDSRTVSLRPDTAGGLVALDDPWDNDQRESRFAISRTALVLKTLPNLISPVLLLTSHVTRISPSLIFSRTVFARQPGEGHPVLRVRLDGQRGVRTVNRLALQALGRLRMDYSILTSIDDRSRRERALRSAAVAAGTRVEWPKTPPGQIWPIRADNTGKFPIGTGVGMHHLRLLHDHVHAVFQDAAEPLEMREVAMRLPSRPTDPERNLSEEERARRKANGMSTRGNAFPSAESVAASIETTGHDKLRLVCLWYRDETRLRMLSTLRQAFQLPAAGLDPHDGEEVPLHGDKITAVFHEAADFLAPGRPEHREEAWARLRPSLPADGGVLTAAWCETEIPVADADEDAEAKNDRDDLDAKHHTRQILASHGVPSQYLRGTDDRGVVIPEAKDHPAEAALLDLYRSLGVIDARIANALRPAKSGHFRADRVAHVGVHVRRQNKRPGETSRPRIVITAAAIIPPATDDGTWTMLGWSSSRPGWQLYQRAQTSFHSTRYPRSTEAAKTDRQRWDEAAELVEKALGDLADELDGTPYIVTVDQQATRRMWSGLQNSHQGEKQPGGGKSRHWLPGATLSLEDRPQAVVRVGTADDEVPQPVSVTHIKRNGESKNQQTATTLFKIATDFGTPVWILSNVPRNYDGGTGGGPRRPGATRTRWDAQRSVSSDDKKERRRSEIPLPWYSMTATEIYPVSFTLDVPEETLAIATASLCHQTQFWSDRARYPVPLHAAKQMDLDHPQYRRSAQAENSDLARSDTDPGTD